MKKTLLFLFILAIGLSTIWAQKTVLGVEANGPDSATIKAYEWRKPNVYDGIYAKAGFKVVLLSQSSKSKVQDALKNNHITHITGCGHGSPTVYTGYNQGVVFSTGDTALLAQLSKIHVHLLSCLTAQQLGPAMMKQGAASYAGYHPSFYFTWKSANLFFEADAAIDKAFAGGKNAPQAYQETIKKFNEILEILNKQDPEGVKYVVIDRDGLRCMPYLRSEIEYVLPIEVATRTLFTKDNESGKFVTFADSHDLQVRNTFRDMDDAEFKNMVLAGYERLEKDFELGILSYGKLTRDQIIEEIRQDSEIGKQLVELDKYFLNTVSQSRWSQSLDVTTDANGCIEHSGEFDVPFAITTSQVKATWTGEPASFQNVNLVFNTETLFDGTIVNNNSYNIVKKVPKGHVTASVKAVGGPKNAKVKVTVYFSLG